MQFNSLEFIILFLVSFMFFYHFRSNNKRIIVLLLASYLFYGWWNPLYLLLILFSTIVDFFVSIYMHRQERGLKRKFFLVLSLGANLGLLIFFKYFDFISKMLYSVTLKIGEPVSLPVLNLLLPIGISFYTFQTLSYTIDVYRGDREPERNFFKFSLYVSFFPQLVAGPIERSTTLLPQFSKFSNFSYKGVASGFRLILWGLVKKTVISDRLSLFVDPIFSNSGEHLGVVNSFAVILFAFQIYFDFSGYSDIAIGTARTFGYDIMQNFRSPYIATSITDFWRRWHISLSTWFRDYVYIPLGGSKCSAFRRYINIVIVFVLSGIWHGAGTGFVIWGFFHGALLCTEKFLSPWYKTLFQSPKHFSLIILTIQRLITFFLVCFGWIFFRCQGIAQSVDIITRLHTGWSFLVSDFSYVMKLFCGDNSFNELIFAVMGIIIIEIGEILKRKESTFKEYFIQTTWVRWAVYISLTLVVANWGIYEEVPFIYFQF